MRALGVVRKIDGLGRIVLPVDLRRDLDINIGDPLEMLVEGQDIALVKYKPTCIFCSEQDNLTLFKEKLICKDCRESLKKL